jgi:hypothetical protein
VTKIGPFRDPSSAKTSCERLFSGSRCYQSSCLTIDLRWAIHQGRLLRASIPSPKMEKKRKTEKSGSKNGHFRGNRSKMAANRKNRPRKTSENSRYSSFEMPPNTPRSDSRSSPSNQ